MGVVSIYGVLVVQKKLTKEKYQPYINDPHYHIITLSYHHIFFNCTILVKFPSGVMRRIM
jgi:hypothetical protein